MRVTTGQLYTQAMNRIVDLQASANELQNQIATGKRISSPGDDAVGAAAVHRVNNRLDDVTQFDRNGVQAEARLTQADDVMGSAGNVLQRVHDLVLQGRSETLSPSDRRDIATEIREQMDVLIELGNVRNTSGEYIFSGASVGTRPFTRDATGTVTYNGDEVVRRVQISESRSVVEGFSGNDALFDVRNGNGTFVTRMAAGNTGTAQISDNIVSNGAAYVAHDFRISFTSPTTYSVIDDTVGANVLTAQPYVAGSAISFAGMAITVFGAPQAGDEFSVGPSQNQSMFATLNNVATTLETGFDDNASTARFGFDMDRTLEDLDLALDKVSEVRATAGARLNSIDAQRNLHEDVVHNLKTLRSNLEDVDMAGAISQLTLETTALDAAQKAFIRVQGLTLFNYL